MKKLKIAVALLVMLFAAQAVFAGAFVPVQRADAKVVAPLGGFCDALQNLAQGEGDKVAFYQKMAAATDDQIDAVIARFGIGTHYVSATKISDLEALFPRGIEETSLYNAFRRAAIHLAIYVAKNGSAPLSEAPCPAAMAYFNIVGYDFRIEVEENTLYFKYVDAVGQDEIAQIGKALMAVAPGAVSFSNPTYGVIAIETNGLTDAGFDTFVSAAMGLVYGTIY